MRITICPDPTALGRSAAQQAASIIGAAIAEKGEARIAVSTGSSQFETLAALIDSGVDFSKVVMFHLDEYVDLPITHPASFRKYLNERFISKISLKEVHLVDGTPGCIESLTREIRKAPIDLGLIGIGENAHIAFNDPPANFDSKEAYIVVDLDDACKKQQVGEGWFPTLDDVPKQAVSMTCYQIMQCKAIISSVPHAVKATAIEKTLMAKETSNMIPATLLKTHADWSLYLDAASAQKINPDAVKGANSNLEEIRTLG